MLSLWVKNCAVGDGTEVLLSRKRQGWAERGRIVRALRGEFIRPFESEQPLNIAIEVADALDV
jgi:hypothetical protein